MTISVFSLHKAKSKKVRAQKYKLMERYGLQENHLVLNFSDSQKL